MVWHGSRSMVSRIVADGELWIAAWRSLFWAYPLLPPPLSLACCAVALYRYRFLVATFAGAKVFVLICRRKLPMRCIAADFIRFNTNAPGLSWLLLSHISFAFPL